jgi:hypothetical protein
MDSGRVAGSLRSALDDFQRRFNENRRAVKLATGWDRQILLEPTDSSERYAMLILGASLQSVTDDPPDDPRDSKIVRMCATGETLTAIFMGDYNPSTALLDGMLEVYSDTRDKVKLEALAMVIWGL